MPFAYCTIRLLNLSSITGRIVLLCFNVHIRLCVIDPFTTYVRRLRFNGDPNDEGSYTESAMKTPSHVEVRRRMSKVLRRRWANFTLAILPS